MELYTPLLKVHVSTPGRLWGLIWRTEIRYPKGCSTLAQSLLSRASKMVNSFECHYICSMYNTNNTPKLSNFGFQYLFHRSPSGYRTFLNDMQLIAAIFLDFSPNKYIKVAKTGYIMKES
ncbi:hypothetical protein TNCV_840581 [Trichonephila clavipes]|nr:hypothetical protein TNCV_840581 [Trichonephila clavipes]